MAITRCGNFYGGGDLNWNRIVPGTIRSVLRGERPVIRSDGQFVRDYFYVEDGAAAYMLLAEALARDPSCAGEAFNFSNELQVTVLDLVEQILRLMKIDLEPDVRNEATNEIRHQYLSAAKARRDAGLDAAVHPRRRAAPDDRTGTGSSSPMSDDRADAPPGRDPRTGRGDITPRPSRPRTFVARRDARARAPAASSTPRSWPHLVDASLDFWLTTGRFAEQFEREFARRFGVRHAMLVNSGSSANLLALTCLTSPKLGDRRLQPGDEVITVAAGFPTTVNPIIQNGLVPVFVDVHVPTYNIDVTPARSRALGPDPGRS